MTGEAPNDARPRLAEVFRELRAGKGPIWVTWEGRRLLLGLPDDAWLAAGEGPAIVATRRGYRKVVFSGRLADGGHLTSARGAPKSQPLRIADDYFRPIAPRLVRAVILEDHAR